MPRITPATDHNISKHRIYSWKTCATGDTFDWLDCGEYPDKTVQVTGTLTSVKLVGSNDGITEFDLNDTDGNGLTFTAPGAKLIRENPRYIRPANPTGTNFSIFLSVAQ